LLDALKGSRFTTQPRAKFSATSARPRQSSRHVYPACVSLHLMAGPPHSTPSCSCGQQTARNTRTKSQLRAAFSSGNNASCLSKQSNASSPVQPAISRHFARRPIQGLVSTQHGSVLPVHSFSTYRDEGALSEIAIADYLSEQLPHSSTADLQAGSAQTQLLVTSSATHVHKKVLMVSCLFQFCVHSQSFADCADTCDLHNGLATSQHVVHSKMLAHLQLAAL